jgi:hypothetical protein
MKSLFTSYNGLFSHQAADAPAVRRIEIPIIQRDYAQGRDSDAVTRIRDKFLSDLHDAVTSEHGRISLDFIYGDVVGGALRPLDGQQRLTTLFLLHWYLAWRTDQLDLDLGWKRFEYATRPSARRFCNCLVSAKPPHDATLRSWFEDQYWFLHTWRHDPTIQSMLVMLEAMHERFEHADCAAAWARLIDPTHPAIAFHLLPIEQMGLSEELYITMNSRGKPLTAFENFKARFEALLESSVPDRVNEFANKVDGQWTDVLWPLRGKGDIVDDELLRYLRFVTELCAWSDGLACTDDLDLLAERVFGPANEKAAAHLDFLMRCFDTWTGVDIAAEFAKTFSLAPAALTSNDFSKVALFASGSTVNLFAECCNSPARLSWPRTLLLYSVLLHRLHGTVDFPRRLRMLRNLIEASNNEMRAERMPTLLADVRRLIIDGELEGIAAFNQLQVADETSKVGLLAKAPDLARDLFHLEDHRVLRGCLTAFELDPDVFSSRARVFHAMFADRGLLPLLTGAMLAAGDYGRRSNGRFMQLGSGAALTPWRTALLTGASREQLANVRAALAEVLDTFDNADEPRAALTVFTQRWLDDQIPEHGLDWRWYLIRYPEMRAGQSGVYAYGGGAPGYSLCMLDKQAMSSYYRDPFLTAMRRYSDIEETAVSGAVWQTWPDGPWFTGYETSPRWMRLATSGIELRCVDQGIQLRTPASFAPAHAEAFAQVCNVYGIGPDFLLRIPQVEIDDKRIDIRDRVQAGATLLRDLVAAGL